MSSVSRTTVAAAVDETPRFPSHRSTMLERFGLVVRLLVRMAFPSVRVRPEVAQRVRQLAAQGTVVYVLRYRSFVDYLLVNVVLLREGLPLARFAPGLSTVSWRPLGEAVQWAFGRVRRWLGSDPEVCGRLVASGESVLLFLRSHAVAGRRRRALAAARLGPQYLRAVVAGRGHGAAAGLPGAALDLVRSRIPQARITLRDAAVQRPGDAERGAEAPHVHVARVGDAARPRAVRCRCNASSRSTGAKATSGSRAAWHARCRSRCTARSAIVLGPTLLPQRLVRETVLRDPELVRLTRRLAAERGIPRRKVAQEATGYIDEMAAHFNGRSTSGILEFLFNRICPRVFTGLETVGLERVVECMREHPIVLVPCHRSHFDYLILSYIFHSELPVAAAHRGRDQPVASGRSARSSAAAGAYFIRRSFDDNELYKMVFRKYLTFLIREGYTQEFFIEGGRTRTGKMLQPKLGMLSAIVNAFVAGRAARPLPGSGLDPLRSRRRRKRRTRARSRARRRSGSRSARCCGRAASCRSASAPSTSATACRSRSSETLGRRREEFRLRERRTGGRRGEAPASSQRLGFRILREVNAVAVAGASSVSATALLGAPQAAESPRGLPGGLACVVGAAARPGRAPDGVAPGATRRRRSARVWRGSRAAVWSGRLVDGDGVVLHVPHGEADESRLLQEQHHPLLPLAGPADPRLAGRRAARPALSDDVGWWLDLYRWEFPLPERSALPGEIDRWLEEYGRLGCLVDGRLDAAHIVVRATSGILENFREAYWIAARTMAAQRDWPVKQSELLQRMRREFATSLLLGEAHKPEGSSMVTFANAISRLTELGHIRVERRGRDRIVERGPAFQALPELVTQLRS